MSSLMASLHISPAVSQKKYGIDRDMDLSTIKFTKNNAWLYGHQEEKIRLPEEHGKWR